MSGADPILDHLLVGSRIDIPHILTNVKSNWIVVLASIAIGYYVCLGAYRVFLSPLSTIPGPKLAALTFWYEHYYDAYLSGKYFRAIDEMHEKYGPIVRVNPDEVHFNDPDFLDTLYPLTGRKTGKPPVVPLRTGTPNSIVATLDHDQHRFRRNALNSFFSGASIRRLEPIMREYLDKMLARIETLGKSSEVVQIHHVFKAMTNDVITLYAFGESFDLLEREDFGRPYFEAVDIFFAMNHIFAAAPWYAALVQIFPGWLVTAMNPSLKELWDKKTWWLDKCHEIRNSPNPERIKTTIFEGILSSSLPAAEKTDDRLASEAQLVIFAGEGTTAYTLNAAVYELLAHPAELQRLKDELAGAGVQPNEIPAFSQIDGLPFLTAVIQEVVRCHPGVMNRQFRTSPEAEIVYHDKKNNKTHVLPAGTIFSISPLSCHMNPEAFDDPYDFRPQRWLDNPSIVRGFMGFSRGSRSCVGMNLAKRELALVLATLFSRYDLYRGQAGPTLELYDTTRERDIDPYSDMIIPVPAPGSQGLRVRVRC